VSLDIADGEFVVLVGPSGCGKSTILRLIAGLDTPTSGKIYLDGRLINDVSPKDRDMAMVFQNYALYPHMTIEQNLSFALRIRKFDKREIKKRVEEVAQMLEISHLLKRKPAELSGGQRQRVAMGRAIIRRPKVFLFDEPLSNLDASLRVQMRAELMRLHDELKSTMVYVTHDQIEAMTLADRLVVLKDGIVQQIGKPQNIFQNPSNIFVAGFIGSPPMNFIKVYPLEEDSRILISRDGAIRIELNEDDFSLKTPDLTIGIRPSDIEVFSIPAMPKESLIRAKVSVVEPVGTDSFLHVKAGECNIMVRMSSYDAVRMNPGSDIYLNFKKESIYVFEGGSGKLIWHGYGGNQG
jgi:multiple sugar transport system ATP-binding protein